MLSSESTKRLGLKLSLTAGVCGLAFFYALTSGASEFSLIALLRGQLESQLELIFWEIRLPRILIAALCGAALAAAGMISQGLFRNPLAGPSIIGTTGGANLLVVITMFLGFAQFSWWVQPLAACAGALASTLLVLQLMRWRFFEGGERLLLLGFALNALYAAVTSFLLSLSLEQYGLSQSILYWLMGGVNGKGWSHFGLLLPGVFLGLCLARHLAAQLDVLNLGEEVAASLSIRVLKLRILSVVCLSLLVGSAVAVSGGIGFVGLIVPHFSRLYVGAQHRRLLPFSVMNGMSLLLFADTLARTMWAPQELQVGVIISLVGAPVFILLLLLQTRKGRR